MLKNIVYIGLVGLAIKGPSLLKFIENQNKFFDEVSVYTPDLEGLQQKRIDQIENDDKPFYILDEKTGRLKHTGWMKRDKNVQFNRDAVKADESNNWLKEITKRRHQTLITTFSDKKISIYRLFDFEINTVAVTTHILKAKKNDDPLQSMADDMTTKEPMGIVYSDVSSVGIQPFNVTSDYETIILSEKKNDGNERVLNLYEKNTHPFNFEFDLDIFIQE